MDISSKLADDESASIEAGDDEAGGDETRDVKAGDDDAGEDDTGDDKAWGELGSSMMR